MLGPDTISGTTNVVCLITAKNVVKTPFCFDNWGTTIFMYSILACPRNLNTFPLIAMLQNSCKPSSVSVYKSITNVYSNIMFIYFCFYKTWKELYRLLSIVVLNVIHVGGALFGRRNNVCWRSFTFDHRMIHTLFLPTPFSTKKEYKIKVIKKTIKITKN